MDYFLLSLGPLLIPPGVMMDYFLLSLGQKGGGNYPAPSGGWSGCPDRGQLGFPGNPAAMYLPIRLLVV
eukprot:137013-Prorocentrum_minimum.AAC.1